MGTRIYNYFFNYRFDEIKVFYFFISLSRQYLATALKDITHNIKSTILITGIVNSKTKTPRGNIRYKRDEEISKTVIIKIISP